MSNLGAYQIMTTLAKKVGGPAILAVLTAVGGYIFLRPVEAGITKGVKNVKKHIGNKKRHLKISKYIKQLQMVREKMDFNYIQGISMGFWNLMKMLYW